MAVPFLWDAFTRFQRAAAPGPPEPGLALFGERGSRRPEWPAPALPLKDSLCKILMEPPWNKSPRGRLTLSSTPETNHLTKVYQKNVEQDILHSSALLLSDHPSCMSGRRARPHWTLCFWRKGHTQGAMAAGFMFPSLCRVLSTCDGVFPLNKFY